MKPASQLSDSPAVHRCASAGGFGLAALWSLYVLTFRQHMHGKRWLIMAALFLLPAGLAVLIRATSPDAAAIEMDFLLAFMFIPQALLPLVALVYASGIINDEQEDQTLTYLLIRPLPKWAIYVVKMLATLTTTILLTAFFTVLTYVAIYIGSGAAGGDVALRCLKAVGIHCLAVATYCCLFGLLSLLTRWALIVGIVYAALFEGLLANMPFGVRLVTVIYYTRLIAYRTMDFKLTQMGRTEDFAAELWKLDVQNDPQLLEHPSLRLCFLVLAVAGLVFTMIAAFLCSQREFHVKTSQAT
ncbi:MAG TPA: ABC transporter permease [Gemmataceae bacterium]|nr:ABC transporter permease [Gemmataceae bacterium]